ncbi:hypothetical protein ACFQZ8_08900 [Micromonospora azadirachtae]|uniref:Cupin n=1 Tax=Micromonospora azadirachtae TaxID=1970735 RepID=A0ABW2ZZG4_9ACTN
MIGTPTRGELATAALLFERGSPDELRAVTRSFVDGVATGRLGCPSVDHPLGFRCFPVLRDGLDGLCVHAWLPHAAPSITPANAVHAHSWDLTSFVAVGTLGNQLHTAREHADGRHELYEVRSTARHDEIRATGRRVDVTAEEMRPVREGTVYRLPAGAFHLSDDQVATPIVTLVLGTGRPDMANLIVDRPGQVPRRTRRTRHTPDVTRDLARSVRALLA